MRQRHSQQVRFVTSLQQTEDEALWTLLKHTDKRSDILKKRNSLQYTREPPLFAVYHI